MTSLGKAELAAQVYETQSGAHLEVGRIDEHKGRQQSASDGAWCLNETFLTW